MKATFCFSKTMPSITAMMPSTMVEIFETRISSCSLALPPLRHGGVEIVADRRGARQRQARHHREDRGESHRRDEAQEQVAADRVGEMDRRHVGAAADQRDDPWPVRSRNAGLVDTSTMAPKPMMKVRM